jgi:hypothetical protein
MGRPLWIALIWLPLAGCTAPLRLPEDPLRMAMPQRHEEVIPGSHGRLVLGLGDITAGQVLVTIHQKGGDPVLPLRSVKPGDVVPFKVRGQAYYLSVVELRNLLFGPDLGVFELSQRPPAASQTQTAGPNNRQDDSPNNPS